MAPLAPPASPFPQLSFCLFAAPTSLSTSFILTFKSFQACSEMAQTLLLLFAGLWNAENPRTGGRAGLHARSGHRGPGAFAGRWASGSKNVGQGRGCCRLLQAPTGRMLLAFQVSFLLTMPGPCFFLPEDPRITPSVPFLQEGHSYLPSGMMSSPSSWFLLITGPPVFRRGCQRKQTQACWGFQSCRCFLMVLKRV